MNYTLSDESLPHTGAANSQTPKLAQENEAQVELWNSLLELWDFMGPVFIY